MYATPEDCDMNEGGKAPSEPAAPIYGELLVLGYVYFKPLQRLRY